MVEFNCSGMNLIRPGTKMNGCGGNFARHVAGCKVKGLLVRIKRRSNKLNGPKMRLWLRFSFIRKC